jgi:membrane protein YdbS with pleckstrin-like domain
MDNCIKCGALMNRGARFCAACGAPAETEETRVASKELRGAGEETRFAPEEQTRLAAARPWVGQQPPQPVRPLAEANAPARRDHAEEAEQVVFTVRPTLLFIKLGYVLAALGGVALVVLLALLGRWAGVNVPYYVSVPLALALLLIPAFYHFRRNTVRYTLTDSKIEMDEGFISKTTRNVPLRNIQDVTVTSTVFQRMLRFGNVVVDNAGAEGATTVLRNIPDPRRHADLLLRELRRWR